MANVRMPAGSPTSGPSNLENMKSSPKVDRRKERSTFVVEHGSTDDVEEAVPRWTLMKENLLSKPNTEETGYEVKSVGISESLQE